jgi:hypothetical protein
MDDSFWELLAYCAGTGGSADYWFGGWCCGYGSEKVEFFWYVKKMLACHWLFRGIEYSC